MPQKKTRTAKQKRKTKNTTMTARALKILQRTPTPYPFSPVSPTSKGMGTITSSSTIMKAVTRDGKNWHVDTDVNGVKKHANLTNLTNSQIMDILAYPAAKQDLKTRLLQEFRNIQHPMFAQQPQIIAQNIGTPIIRMDAPFEEPQIQYKYIYKNGCSNKPVMLNKLSPLHEAKIVPDSSGEPIHLIDIGIGKRGSIKPLRKTRTKKKKYRKNRK
jgi:hypothetical protein